ncbi:hypothetical protein FOC4_g10002789 [Fusarium odoratissimum]|uniref:Uncharacterized protein n=3 Tax=Fusarium oxysporum species complex TaxID=171631 RepID=N1S9X8_FUSC4|nr:uncharacterized protein FOIG_12576 [Fusarium odoratissimum NRRL 54006]EMT73762.1 hypothetical protein FOC4_g10002789 [Fusarium odoratissimum]EXL94730.1 hypothetical protein FOIG_12576 [Fusarium odoratissimum NRRL 54006]TXC05803.1 hypothetical protein FocTR4_00010725 [Fusarium oxysporum f. sp. cubense]
MSSQSSSSSSKDTSKKESSELKKLHFVASFEHQKLLEDVSNKAYDLGVKAGREQANPPDDETQALILSLTDRNDELEKQIKDLATDALLDLAKDVRNNVTSAHRAVSSATHADGLTRNYYRILRESCSELSELEDKCKERVDKISRAANKRVGGALKREDLPKRPFLG